MSLADLYSGTIAHLDSALPEDVRVYGHEGAFTAKDIERCAVKAPCVIVGFDRARAAVEGGMAVAEVDVVLVLLVKNVGGVKRTPGALDLLTKVLQSVHSTDFGVDCASSPTGISARNFYRPELAEDLGCAMWAVGYTQMMDLPPDLDGVAVPFLGANVSWDLVETDGLYEATDTIKLQGKA